MVLNAFKKTAMAVVLTVLAAMSTGGQMPPKAYARLLFAGDILLSRNADVDLKQRIGSPWRKSFQELFQKADWVGGNLEGAIGDPKDCIKTQRICLATPATGAQVLATAGFRAVTIENNHTQDVGDQGREQSRQTFRKVGLSAVDFDTSPQFVQLNNIEIALIAVNLVRAADGRRQQIPSAELQNKLRLAKSRADAVIVSIHWGNEMMQFPSPAQREQAAWLIKNGADLVLGHHPHVIQAPQCVAGRPVFFSLGNFVFDQPDPKTKEGLIADCFVGNGQLKCRALRTQTKPGRTCRISCDQTLPTVLRCLLVVRRSQ